MQKISSVILKMEQSAAYKRLNMILTDETRMLVGSHLLVLATISDQLTRPEESPDIQLELVSHSALWPFGDLLGLDNRHQAHDTILFAPHSMLDSLSPSSQKV